jgi:hypothetical protein
MQIFIQNGFELVGTKRKGPANGAPSRRRDLATGSFACSISQNIQFERVYIFIRKHHITII